MVVFFPAELPSGYRFIQLRDKTATPWIGEMVRQRPQFESYAWGSFLHRQQERAVYRTRARRQFDFWIGMRRRLH